MQLAVNRRQEELDAAIRDALPGLADLAPRIEWRSPLEADGLREYWDAGMLKRIGRPELADRLRAFWPTGGPHWDGLAVVRSKAGEALGPLLVEAKSYPAEMRSSCAARGDSRARIEQRLAETRRWLGVTEDHAPAWTDGYYQSANRLTFLRFFREVLREQAWMVNLCVVHDPDPDISTTREEWDAALGVARAALGLTRPELDGYGTAFIGGAPQTLIER